MIAVALIPPRGLEGFALHSNMHMALATNACRRNEDYVGIYTNIQTGFIMLDNGANEGETTPGDVILSFAEEIGAHEIVLPDVMGNRDRTIDSVDRFIIRYMREMKKYRGMAVVHAETERTAMNTIRYWAGNPRIQTIGIPRIYVEGKYVNARIELAQQIQDKLPGRFDIHFLGAVPTWAGEIKAVLKYAPFVRSLDTSLPFNFAIARMDLSKNSRARISRPPVYFSKDFGGIDKGLLKANIDTYIGWGRG